MSAGGLGVAASGFRIIIALRRAFMASFSSFSDISAACAPACPRLCRFSSFGLVELNVWRLLCEKPDRYAMEPHSTSFWFSHCSDTGFVRKSLHPAASAATRSLCREDAVRATMITGSSYGEAVPELLGETDPGPSLDGLLAEIAPLFARSISRIS